jgi:hypothetical protein
MVSTRNLARPRSSSLDDDKHRIVVEVIGFAHRDDAQRTVATERDTSPECQFGTTVLSVGGSAGEPSSFSSVKVKDIRSPLLLGDRTAGGA